MPIYQHKTYTDDEGRTIHVRAHEPQDNECRLPFQFLGSAEFDLPEGKMGVQFAIDAKTVADAFAAFDETRDKIEKEARAEVAKRRIVQPPLVSPHIARATSNMKHVASRR